MANDYNDSGTEPAEPKRDKGEATALLPKNFFPGDKPLEVGNVCKVKIARVLDDQVEVTYMHSKDDDDEDEVVEDDEIAAMMD